MSIILNENDWAKQVINSPGLGKKPTETLRRVARFYLDEGYSAKEVRTRLDSFILQCDSKSSLPKWADTLDYVMRAATKYKAVNIDHIPVSETELHRIETLNEKQTKRLAFTLLCLAKYWKEINPNSDYWVNTPDNEIMTLANIKTSIKRQSLIYWTLREEGMVQFSHKVDNINVRVCFVDNGSPSMRVTDFRNLGYQYLMYCGEPYFECENCGITTKIHDPNNKRRQKYCDECAAKMRIEQSVNRVMRHRKSQKIKV